MLEPHLGGVLADEGVRTWAARAIIFIVVLLIGTAIGADRQSPRAAARCSAASTALFGGLSGCCAGCVIMGLFVILCHALRLEGEPWWRGSMLVPYAEHAANVLRGMVGERKIRGCNTRFTVGR